jgi:hypothetical protein
MNGIKFVLWFAFLTGNVYVVNLCFKGMSYPSDATFIGGILGMLMLYVIDIYIIKKLMKTKETN